MNAKKLFGIVLVPVFLVLLVTGCGEKKADNNNNGKGNGSNGANTVTHTIDEKTVEGLTFKDAVIEYKNNESSFNVKVVNNTDAAINVNQVIMHLKDKDNNELFYLVGTIGEEIAPGSDRTIGSAYAGDLSETVNVDYEVIKG